MSKQQSAGTEPAFLGAPSSGLSPEGPLPAAPTAARLERLLRQQETLRAFIESISAELELRPLLTRILRHACELIGADNGTIGLVDEARVVVRTEAVYRMPPGELGAEMPLGVGIAGVVLQRKEPIVLERYAQIAHPTQLTFLENAVIGMPISWRGRMIGFFGIGASPVPAGPEGVLRRRHFTPQDVATLGIFARHAAIAIENARRYELERQRTERLELIARIGRIMTADLRLSELLQSAADAIHELLGYPNIAIPLIDPEDPHTLVLQTVGGHYKHIVKGEYRLPIDGGLMGAAVRERGTVLVNDVEADPRYIRTPGAQGITAELAVPIVLGDRVLGVVNVESGVPFSDEDAASLRIIADQLAVAIENARLYERGQRLAAIEERQRLARDLHDSVTQDIAGMLLLAQALPSACRRDPAEAARQAGRLVDLSASALAEMRALLSELRPADAQVAAGAGGDSNIARVRRDGLSAALAVLAAESRRHNLRVSLRTAGYLPQPPEREEALFRITQEALNNVAKHAHAAHVHVRLSVSPDALRLSIQDDGDGISSSRLVPAGPASGGHGLAIMRERAEAIGASLRIRSAIGRGTLIEVRVLGAVQAAAIA
jgi:signal transduction histidine kinase